MITKGINSREWINKLISIRIYTCAKKHMETEVINKGKQKKQVKEYDWEGNIFYLISKQVINVKSPAQSSYYGDSDQQCKLLSIGYEQEFVFTQNYLLVLLVSDGYLL